MVKKGPVNYKLKTFRLEKAEYPFMFVSFLFYCFSSAYVELRVLG